LENIVIDSNRSVFVGTFNLRGECPVSSRMVYPNITRTYLASSWYDPKRSGESEGYQSQSLPRKSANPDAVLKIGC